jgi:hypothetical protein
MFLSNFQRSLAAVIVGNLIYFSISPLLPPALHHGFSEIRTGKIHISMGKFDWGLLLDFAICTTLYIVFNMLWSDKRREGPKTQP